MTGILFKIISIFMLVLFCYGTKEKLFSENLKDLKPEIIPVASFLFAHREPMRVGWYNLQNYKQAFKNKKPVGTLFVQLRPKKFEEDYELALRVLKKGFKNLHLIKEFTDGEELNYQFYITIPFQFLNGAIQGEALRNIFPNDRVEFGGWLHHFTYDWETPELISKSFTFSKKNIFQKNNYIQGEKLKIPWSKLRPDLELKPLALREPLFIKKDETGVRYAFYKFQTGDTLYSAVITRFLSTTKKNLRKKSTLDLLDLNGISDAHRISKGQKIKIPLKWIKDEYFHQVPSIYRNFFESNQKQHFPSLESQTEIQLETENKNNLNVITQS